MIPVLWAGRGGEDGSKEQALEASSCAKAHAQAVRLGDRLLCLTAGHRALTGT